MFVIGGDTAGWGWGGSSLISTASGLRWGIPLSGGGGGPAITGDVGTLSSDSLLDPMQ